jgi:putative transposase
MAVAPRLDFPGAYHHVMARGINGTDIFRDDQDRDDFIKRLASALDDNGSLIHAWALQPNHIHLLVQSGPRGISNLMRKVLGGYARAFNQRQNRVGYLFQGRFRSILVEVDSYFLELVRYIHLNPLRSKIVWDVNQLNRFPWTGHGAILGTRSFPWQTTSAVLSYFGDDREIAARQYLRFVTAGKGVPHQPDLELGRLVNRTLGGLSRADERKRGRERWCGKERVLGSATFISGIAGQLGLGRLRLGDDTIDPAELALLLGCVAEQHNIDVGELRAGSQRRIVVRARASFCRRACRHVGVPVAEVAGYLGITPRAVRYLAERE